jgi:hypothetical protein
MSKMVGRHRATENPLLLRLIQASVRDDATGAAPMADVVLFARCPVPDCSGRGKPHEQIVSRATFFQMFDPDGNHRIFFCSSCGNVFTPSPAEKE